MKKSNRNLRRRSQESAANLDAGRVAQRNRTRKAIVDATMRLLSTGRTPSIVDVVKEAQVSRRTIYMYFPTVEQLLLDATLGALSADAVGPLISQPLEGDVHSRVEQLSRAANKLSGDTMHLGRALIRLTVEAEEPRSGGPRRGYRRVQWIENALESLRAKLTGPEFERLVSALTVLVGWEPLIVLQDVRGLSQKEAESVLAFAARAVVDAALKTPHPESVP